MESEQMGDSRPLYSEMLVEVEGIVLPKMFEANRSMKEHIDCIRGLNVRDDDVFICAFAKSGTHWTWEVVNMLVAGKSEYKKEVKDAVMLEVIETETIESLKSPRVLNTHLPIRMLPRQLKDRKGRIIYVYRNPKDLFVSMYFHFSQLPDQPLPLTFEALEELFFTGKTLTGDYFRYMKEMDAFIKENPELQIFKISFEDMKEDPVGAVSSFAAFLGISATPELCAEIADACSFQKLKHAQETYKEISPLYSRINKTPAKMHRKGEVGDWKNYMTVAQSERFDAAIKELDGCDYRFRYQL